MKSSRPVQIFVAACVAGFLLSGCIPSLNPFYKTSQVHFEPQLLGEWQEKEDPKETWKFERADNQRYKLTITEKGSKTGTCDAVLFKLQEELFLDLIPNDCRFADDQAELVQAALIPGHLLVRVSLSGSELKRAYCDYEWLEKHLKSHPKAVAHRVEEKGMVLTARTAELQQFVAAHLGEGELFQKPTQLVRH